MTRYSVEIDSKQVFEALDQLRGATDDLEPAFDAIGDEFANTRIPLLFRAEKDPYGKKWDDLSEVTIERKRKGPRPEVADKILRDRSILAPSFTYDASDRGVRVGTSVEYAEQHYTGTSRIPQRAMMPTPEGGFPKDWQDFMINTFVKHFTRRVSGITPV